MAGAPPHVTADTLGQALTEACDWISSFSVVKGFLNLSLTDACWNAALQDALTQSDWGHAPNGSKPQVMVEYSSPNTNKPLHLGHLRNNFLGYSVSRILEAAGHDVKKVQIINDRGIHICKSMVAGRNWDKARRRHRLAKRATSSWAGTTSRSTRPSRRKWQKAWPMD